MKKILVLFLCFGLLVSLIGCGTKTNEATMEYQDEEDVEHEDHEFEEQLIADIPEEDVPEIQHLSQMKGYDQAGNLIYELILTYHKDGSLDSIISKRRYDYDGISNIYEYTKTYFYDDNGHLIRVEKPEDGYVFVDEYEYNKNGQLVNSSAQSGEGWSMHSYNYNNAGQCVGAVSQYQAYVDTTEYSYDSSGLLIESHTVRDFGDSFPEYYTSTYEYDSEQRVSKIVTAGSSDIKTETYAYDHEGRKEAYIAEDDWSTIKEFYSYEYTPFIITNRLEKNQFGEHSFIEVDLYDDTGIWLTGFSLVSPEFFVDEEGYLTSIIDETEVYEFQYGDEPVESELEKPSDPEEEEPQNTSPNQVNNDNSYVNFILQKYYEPFLEEYAYNYEYTDEMVIQCALVDINQDGVPELIIDALDDFGWYTDLVFTKSEDGSISFVGSVFTYSSVEYSEEHCALSYIIARPAYGEVPYAYTQLSKASLVDYWPDEHDDSFTQLNWMDLDQFYGSN